MKKFNSAFLRLSAAIAALALSAAAPAVGAKAEKTNADNEINAVYNYSDENAYALYKEKYSAVKCAAEDIVLQGGTEPYKDTADTEYENTVTFNSAEQTKVYSFSVPEDGLYNIKLRYLPIEGNGNDINFSLKLDGAFPFTEAEQLVLPRMYKDVESSYYDEFGNQYSPEQAEAGEFTVKALYNDAGAENLPYAFYLTAGGHSAAITGGTEPFVLAELIIAAPDSLKPYSEIKAEYAEKGYTAANCDALVLEGEDAALKSTRAIVPKADSGSPIPEPSSPKKQLINYIGGSNWKSPTEEIVWKIEVKESGLYRLGAVYKQDQTVNGFSYRQLRIDGKIPFAEAQSLEFYYGTGWKYYEFADSEGEDYLFYLEKGKHTLSLTATMGVTTEYYNRLKQITEALSNIYLEIAMITGETPDSNRDYDLFKQIDGFNESLEKNRELLTQLAADMKELSNGEETSFISSVKNMARVLKSMLDNPYTAQNYVSDYYNSYTTLSSWLYDMKSMPLCIDRIFLYPSESDEKPQLAGFFEKLGFGIERFIASFADDYGKAASKDGTLEIWINWGRDQAMVLNSLIEESFTVKTGIKVNLELTDATLVKGILSNNAPDLSLHLPRTEPVNLAMRGVLYDLTEFEDYSEVTERFGKSASVPYSYGNGIYALPDTQSFYIMFYRKDILESLEIEVPKTWDEFLAATAVLQRNNMQAWIPYTQITTSTTVNTGVGGLNLFASVLQQFGSGLYNADKTATILDSPTSLKAFTYWTDMYTKYKLPTTASFYNRFRVGTMPIGIEVYTQYTTLKEAAPEIDGRWGIALVPGVEENGAVNHTVSGSGTGCAIMAGSEHKAEAWEFLKWWTSADTQLRYNNNVESILGSVARTTTATQAAFEGMAWDPADLQILLKQRENIAEIPEVAGSYYVSRAVDQAFWSVINGEEAPKDSLTEWAEIANNEIERKIKQYGK